MGGEHDGFPIRAFVTFPIAEQHEDAVRGTVQLAPIGHPDADSQAMPQGARRYFHTGNALVRDVTAESGAVLVVRLEAVTIKKVAFRQSGVDPGSRMVL